MKVGREVGGDMGGGLGVWVGRLHGHGLTMNGRLADAKGSCDVCDGVTRRDHRSGFTRFIGDGFC